MPRLFYYLLTLICFSFSFQAQAIDLGDNELSSWQSDEFLPAEEAFPFNVENRSVGSKQELTTIKVNWNVTPGHYLYAQSIKLQADPNFLESNIVSELKPDFSKQATVKYDPNFDKDMAIFKAQLSASFSFNLNNYPQSAKLSLKFQGCAEAGLCYPMQSFLLSDLLNDENIISNEKSSQNLTKGLTESPPKVKQESFTPNGRFGNLLKDASLFKIILIFLALGIGLCLTPCVLPMMPIISSLVLGREKALSSKQAFGISTTYVLTMSLSYTLVGVLAASLGASANIQIWMQHPVILSVFAAVFVLLAMSMFGLYEIGLPASLSQKLNDLSNKQESGSYAGAAVMGVLSAVVVSPCISAPLAGALVFISSTGDIAIGASALFALGIGMGLPLILLCTLGTNILPKAGVWLEHSKKFFGILLIAVAIWMLTRFIEPQFSLALWGALLVFTSFAFGAWQNANALLKTLLSICLLWGLVMLLGAALGNTKVLQPLENITTRSNNGYVNQELTLTSNNNALQNASQKKPANINTEDKKLNFEVIYSPQDLTTVLNNHKGSNNLLLLDFYADWCTSCKEIEHQIFENPQFREFLLSAKLIRADLTDNTVENFELLEQLNLFGPPAILFYDQQSQELKKYRIQGTITPENFQEIVNALSK